MRGGTEAKEHRLRPCCARRNRWEKLIHSAIVVSAYIQRHAIEIAARIHHRAAFRICPVSATAEAPKQTKCTRRGYFIHRAFAVSATLICGAVKIATGILYHAAIGCRPVRRNALKTVQQSFSLCQRRLNAQEQSEREQQALGERWKEFAKM